MQPRVRTVLGVLVALSCATLASRQAQPPDPNWFFQGALRDERAAREALDRLAATWKHSYTSMVVDLVRLLRPAARPGATVDEGRMIDVDDESGDLPAAARGNEPLAPPPRDPSTVVRERLVRFLEKQTGKRFGQDLDAWRRWMWSLPYDPHPDYVVYKGAVYGFIDPRMSEFFQPGIRATIRLDEIDWGGVKVNGIPPLRYPKHVPAREASYLKDGHVVFGVVAGGEARAYPKRILAWHEMAHDRLGSIELTIVYCTLCGVVMPYESVIGGKRVTFGTSGLLYRSNKLMFDEETKSLWSTLEGKPVVGPLVDSGLSLRMRPVVTTTWGEWRRMHPDTTVLSLDTGYKREYSEGAAYREYFATDRLMFQVPQTDRRLKNKAEVLALLVPSPDGRRQPLALAVEFLRKHPVYHAEMGGLRMVFTTTRDGANRAYDAGGRRFSRLSGPDEIEDAGGRRWRMTEDALVAVDQPSERLPRLAAARAFWFGWYAQFPETELIR